MRRSWLLCVSRGLAVLPSLSPLLLQPLVSLASFRQSSEEGRRLVTRPWKGLGGTWLSPKAAEDPFRLAAPCSPAASRSVCPSLSPSEDGRPRAACRDGDLDPAPRRREPGGTAAGGAGIPGGRPGGPQGPSEQWPEGLFAFPCTLYRRVYLMMGGGSARRGVAGSGTRGWSMPGPKPAEHGEGWDPAGPQPSVTQTRRTVPLPAEFSPSCSA